MKNVFLVGAACLLLVFFCGAGHGHAEEFQTVVVQPGLCGASAPTGEWLDDLLLARQGCCSWHDGMSGECYNGRVVCNDGTLSPSCTCRASETPAEGV